MKKLAVLFILLVLIPSVLADWFYNSGSITVNMKISSDAEIVKTSPNGFVESAAINLTFFPKRTETQEFIRFDTNPMAELTSDSLEFSWKNPQNSLNFGLDADIKSFKKMHEVKEKIKFPIEQLPEDVVAYTKPSETIDSNDEDIIRLASNLVKGEDDLYSAVFTMAEWTKNNINYNLSTMSSDITQKASWVLQNKKGVCGELTSLFIALLRSVGIPARFVSGIAYTNSELFPENWGAHGWAEVYFPNYGWVPFDVTYGEFGWVDPTHIKFKDSIDSNEPSTFYQWLGRNADLRTKKLNIKANLIGQNGYEKTPLDIDVSIFKKEVGFGSYNLVEATIKNQNDFYYATEFFLNKPKEVKIIGNPLKSILLLPGEKKTIVWILKLDSSLNSRYSYTMPVMVSTVDNVTSETSFIANARGNDVSLDEVSQFAKLLEEEKEKKYSGNVVLNCRSGKSEFYDYEDVRVYCAAKNIGNIFLDNIDVCFESQCKKASLGISQAKNFSFSIDKSNTGAVDAPVTLSNNLISKSYYVNFKIDDAPKIEIDDLVFPLNVSYDENFNVSFMLAKKSQSNAKNLEIVFNQNKIQKKWSIDEFDGNRKFAVDFAGKKLKYGKNDYGIDVVYHDMIGREYSLQKEFSIELANATLWQRLLLWFNGFFTS